MPVKALVPLLMQISNMNVTFPELPHGHPGIFQVDNKVIYQSLAMNEVGWHAGDGNDSGNASTIGIEICENADGNYAKAEKNAAYLTASILYENGLPYTAVKRHQDWSGKDCPYNMNHMKKGSMGWTKFKAMVKDEYTKLQLKLSTSSTSLPVGNTMTIKPIVSSKLTNKKVTWSSSNADISSVEAKWHCIGYSRRQCHYYRKRCSRRQGFL